MTNDATDPCRAATVGVTCARGTAGCNIIHRPKAPACCARAEKAEDRVSYLRARFGARPEESFDAFADRLAETCRLVAAVDRYMACGVPYGKDVAMRAMVEAWAALRPNTPSSAQPAVAPKSADEDREEIMAMTPEQIDAELREAGADPIEVGDMGLVAAYLGKSARFRWAGEQQARELQHLLATVRQDERQRRERDRQFCAFEDCDQAPSTLCEGHVLENDRGMRKNTPGAALRCALAVADAAVGWWEDHNGQDCHFCGPYDGKHDVGCPVGEYLEVTGRGEASPSSSHEPDGGKSQ